MPRSAFAAALLVFLAACAGHPAPEQAAAPAAPTRQSVVLVSLDGFRWDYLNRPGARNLRRLAAEGVHAERMVPSFPSLTFPNHYSIVTGLYPEHHGIVSNSMLDSTLGRFSLSDTVAQKDPRWWGGEPIWATARREGEYAAAFFWPGSEAPVGGGHPVRWMKFNNAFPRPARVDSVLDWLQLPDSTPRIVTLYYSDVDHAGHLFGPASPQVDSAIARVDTMIGRLMDGLQVRGLSGRVNLIVVADHGMTPVAPDRVIYLDDLIDLKDVTVVDWTPVGALIPKPGKLDEVYAKLKGANPHMQVWRKGEIPARFHYNDNPRITPIVLLADKGWTIATHARTNSYPVRGGAHGYDNQLVDMGALFVAAGPAFRHGVTVPPFQNIHIYDLLCEILGLRPAPNDGSVDSTSAMLRR